MAKITREAFQNAADRLHTPLEVWVGNYGDCIVLKLYKKSWANPGEDALTAPSRIFFSVWIDPKNEGKLSYNIHALKLRQLKGYKIESRKFADSFRQSFRKHISDWKNVSVDYGPLTLMEGSVPTTPEELEIQILTLCRNFLKIDHLVDDTLARFVR